MEVLILGCGRVGGETAKMLVKNHCQVTVVDSDTSRLKKLQSLYDLRAVAGHAADPAVLREANGKDAEIVIAVTGVDEINLVACRLCELMFGQQKRIARLRNNALINTPEIANGESFGITNIFSPEQIIADHICDTIRHPGCLSVHKFSSQHIVLAAIRVTAAGSMAGETVGAIRAEIDNVDFRIVSVLRDNAINQPDAKTRLFVGDELAVIIAESDLDKLLPLLAQGGDNTNVLIAGGGNIGERVARAMEQQRRRVKIVETSVRRCDYLSEVLQNTLVLNGNAADEHMLREENIADTDMYCALTNDDEENILSTLLAKRLGAKNAIVLINRNSYTDILARLLDNVASPSQLCIGAILAHIRGGDVGVVHSMHQGRAEVIEVVVHGTEGTSHIAGRAIQDIAWPSGVMPGAYIRGGDMAVAHHDSVLKEGDRLILFVAGKATRQVEKLLQVGIQHF